jgi:iron complex outermembrane receptor protein
MAIISSTRFHRVRILLATALGFVPQRVEITVGSSTVTADVAIDPELHYTEVVSVSPDTRSQFESYQPTSVLAGQDLSKQLGVTLGSTLEGQPGVSERSFGPGPTRPVIRGFDGDRVLILEDGQRTGDLSSQSGDHGVNINPAAATKIEVVRGPATLLYGSNALGGLVNVITEVIPMRAITTPSGGFTFDGGTAARQAGMAGEVNVGDGRWAAHFDGSARRSGDVDTPEGEIGNSESRGYFGNAGMSWTGEKNYFGGSYGYDHSRYGIPFVEEGQVSLTPRRYNITVRAGGENLEGAIRGYRASFAYRHYRHDELEGSEVGTQFENDTADLDVLVHHRNLGRLSGTVGGWFMNRAFSATGEEALSPPVDQRSAAGFVYEELKWPHVTLQFGARLDHGTYRPERGLRDRNFTNVSGSVGVLLRPRAAQDRLTVAFSLARAARQPALEELYYFGEHAGNFAFEIGNPDLASEKGLGFDASLRWRQSRVSGEVTYFRNDISDYILRNPITAEEFADRFGESAGDFPIIEYIAADSVLQGVEAHADVSLLQTIFLEAGLDYVRGDNKELNAPLPRIPPLRMRVGVRYQKNAFQAGTEVVNAADQNRVFGAETPTDGYALLKLFAAYSFTHREMAQTITVRLDNALDELYRNHLSLIKDFVPEMGRNLRVIYGVKF